MRYRYSRCASDSALTRPERKFGSSSGATISALGGAPPLVDAMAKPSKYHVGQQIHGKTILGRRGSHWLGRCQCGVVSSFDPSRGPSSCRRCSGAARRKWSPGDVIGSWLIVGEWPEHRASQHVVVRVAEHWCGLVKVLNPFASTDAACPRCSIAVQESRATTRRQMARAQMTLECLDCGESTRRNSNSQKVCRACARTRQKKACNNYYHRVLAHDPAYLRRTADRSRVYRRRRYRSDANYRKRVLEASNAWRRANPGRVRERCRRYYERIKGDPERMEAERDRSREKARRVRSDPIRNSAQKMAFNDYRAERYAVDHEYRDRCKGKQRLLNARKREQRRAKIEAVLKALGLNILMGKSTKKKKGRRRK